MKKLIPTCIFLLLGAFAVYAQSLPSISIVNDTGYTVHYIFVSPAESDEWGDDVLGDRVLRSGETFTYRLTQPLSRVSVYDIRLIDEDGDDYVKWEEELSANARIVFTFDDLW